MKNISIQYHNLKVAEEERVMQKVTWEERNKSKAQTNDIDRISTSSTPLTILNACPILIDFGSRVI